MPSAKVFNKLLEYVEGAMGINNGPKPNKPTRITDFKFTIGLDRTYPEFLCRDCNRRATEACPYKDVHPLAYACYHYVAKQIRATGINVTPTHLPSSGSPILK